jgi:DNA-binding response OmpR family regulator
MSTETIVGQEVREEAARAKSRVLLVDDDARLLDALRRGLSLSGFEVTTAKEAGQALSCVETGWPDVMVLDIMMPGLDGLSLCRLVRERSSVRILMLTALDSVPDRVAGLQMGADDYLVKPCALDELIARIEALMRRSAVPTPTEDRLSFGDMTLNSATWAVYRDGEQIPTTAKEFRLLKIFLENPGRVLTREDILDAVWGQDKTVESNVIDAHIANLRLKLEAGGKKRLVHTVRGVGYVLKEG